MKEKTEINYFVESTNGQIYSNTDISYARGDTRPPEVIFKEGFKPQDYQEDLHWPVNALQSGGNTHNFGNERHGSYTNTGIDANKVVAITAHPMVAPFFPDRLTVNSTSYVYLVILPTATQINYVDDKGTLKLEKENLTAIEIENLIIDTHSLQTVQTNNIRQKHQSDETVIGGFGLWAYEAMAHKIAPENIIGAIKFKLLSKHYDSYLPVDFQYIENVVLNPNFLKVEANNINDTLALEEIKKHYHLEAKKIVEEFNKLSGQKLSTPKPEYGLGGKAIALESFNHEKKRLDIKDKLNYKEFLYADFIIDVILECVSQYGKLEKKFLNHANATDTTNFDNIKKLEHEVILTGEIYYFFQSRLKSKAYYFDQPWENFLEKTHTIIFSCNSSAQRIDQLKQLAIDSLDKDNAASFLEFLKTSASAIFLSEFNEINEEIVKNDTAHQEKIGFFAKSKSSSGEITESISKNESTKKPIDDIDNPKNGYNLS